MLLIVLRKRSWSREVTTNLLARGSRRQRRPGKHPRRPSRGPRSSLQPVHALLRRGLRPFDNRIHVPSLCPHLCVPPQCSRLTLLRSAFMLRAKATLWISTVSAVNSAIHCFVEVFKAFSVRALSAHSPRTPSNPRARHLHTLQRRKPRAMWLRAMAHLSNSSNHGRTTVLALVVRLRAPSRRRALPANQNSPPTRVETTPRQPP